MSLYTTKKTLIEVDTFIDTRGDTIKVLTEEEAKKLPDPLPEGVYKETSKWKRVTWNLHNLIIANSFRERQTGDTIWDSTKFMNSKIRVLLEDWTLGERDESLKLVFEQPIDNPNIKVLSLKTLNAIGEMDRSLLATIYDRAMNKLYPDERLAPNG